MNALLVTVFVSLVLVVGGLVLFASRQRQGDFEHGDRLSLLPLEEDDAPAAPGDRDRDRGAGTGQPQRTQDPPSRRPPTP